MCNECKKPAYERECKTCQAPKGTHKPWCDTNPAYRAGDWS